MIDLSKPNIAYTIKLGSDTIEPRLCGPFVMSDPNKALIHILELSIPLLINRSDSFVKAVRLLQNSLTPLSGSGIKWDMSNIIDLEDKNSPFDANVDLDRFLYWRLTQLTPSKARTILEWMIYSQGVLEVEFHVIDHAPLTGLLSHKKTPDVKTIHLLGTENHLHNDIIELPKISYECKACAHKLDTFGYCYSDKCFHYHWTQGIPIQFAPVLLKENSDFVFKKRPQVRVQLINWNVSNKNVDQDIYDLLKEFEFDLYYLTKTLEESDGFYHTLDPIDDIYCEFVDYIVNFNGNKIGTSQHHYRLEVNQRDMERFLHHHHNHAHIFTPAYI